MENYNDLIKENIQLKERICILEKKEITTFQFYTDIINKNVEINNLKEQNEEFKLRTYKLEQENIELKLRIIKLEKENIELKKENIELKKENIELKKEISKLNIKINKLEEKELRNKIVRCIQDLNRYEKLEQKLKNPYNKKIINLRNFRNEESHFIYEDDSDDTINSKKIYLLEYLKKIDELIKNKIEMIVGKNFIEIIIDYLQNNSIQKEISEEDLIQIQLWWE